MKRIPILRQAKRARRADSIVASLILFCVIGCGSSEPLRPNLILITVDRMAASELSCMGGPDDAGQSICALGEGTGSTHSSWLDSSNPSEASSAASVLTGLPESEHKIGRDGHEFLADALTTVTEEFARVGYTSAAFITSPRVNRSRRLDQGFSLYDDRLASGSRSRDATISDLPDRIRNWIQTSPSPRFIWIHVGGETRVFELDRLLSNLSQTLTRDPGGPGVLFASLRGKAISGFSTSDSIRRKSFEIVRRAPLFWRSPPSQEAFPKPPSRRLTSLLDVAPILRSAARIPPRVRSAPAIDRSLNPNRIQQTESKAPSMSRGIQE